MRKIAAMVLLGALAMSDAHAQSDSDRNWNFMIEPYLLAASINGEAGMGRLMGVPVDVSFSDILENLEMAAMVHAEAQHVSGWGVIFDYGFMDLGTDTTVGLGGVLSASLRQDIWELFVSRRLSAGDGNTEIFAGVRGWDNRVRASIDPAVLPGSASARIDEDWVDPVVGMRWTGPLAERWQLRLRGDIGGFGVGSDFSWAVKATAFFRMTDSLVLEFGYRAVDVDYENDNPPDQGFFAYDATTHGPLVGLVIEF